MAYIGPNPTSAQFAIIDQISGGFNGVATQFNIRVGGLPTSPGQASNTVIYLNGSGQIPSGNITYGNNFDYKVQGSILTFTTPPAAGSTFYGEILGPVLGIGQPSDNTVEPSTITSNSEANFIFPADVTASGNIAGATGLFTTLSGSNKVGTNFVDATSGQFDELDVINTLTVQNLVLENNITVTGTITAATGNFETVNVSGFTNTSGLVASTGTITGLFAQNASIQTLDVIENFSAQNLTADSVTGLINVSGQTVFGNKVEGANLVTAPTGIFTNISGDEIHIKDLTVTGSFNIKIPTGNFDGSLFLQSGIYARSGVISGVLSGETVTGTTANFTTGNFVQLNAENYTPDTITAKSGVFTEKVSGAIGEFDTLNFNGTISTKTGIFTEFLSGETTSGFGASFNQITGQFANLEWVQTPFIQTQGVISGLAADNPITVTGSTGIEVTTSGVIIRGPVTILP